MVIRTIKLTSLFVNTENYRFEPLSSQKEAIDKMIEDQGDKLYSLVDDIVTNGLSPVDLIIVTPNEDSNKYVVLEGNRRITSLKLLNNPTLIDDKYSPLRKKFLFLKSSKSFDMNVRYFHFVEWLNSLCLGITMPSQNTIISLPFPELLAL